MSTICYVIHLVPFLFPEIAWLFQKYSLCFEVPIILEIISAYFAHPYWYKLTIVVDISC